MSDVIPFEVQMEIVKKVDDLNSLIRFRSVSKEWKSYIDSSEFIAGYGFRHTQPPRLMLRYLHYHEDSKEDDTVDEFGDIILNGLTWFHTEEKCICFVDNDDGLALQQHEVVVPDLIQQLRDMRVVGTSRGLLCMHGKNNSGTCTIVVWNPSIRKSVGIVVPNVSHDTTDFGFGVCPITCDPTIIKISYLANSIRWQVEIFTLSSKRWNVIPSSNLPRKSIMLRRPQVVIDRFIYWATHDFDVKSVVDHMKYVIMSFDLITNEFKEVHLPDSINNQVYRFLTISKLRESLVVSEYVDQDVYGVWMMVMEDDGNVTSFKKLFNFDMGNSLVNKLLGFTKRGQPIVESQDEKFEDLDLVAVEVYEPWSEHKTNLGIYGMGDSFFMDYYGETLVLVDHWDCFIYSNMM